MGIKERISSQLITWWAILIFGTLMFLGSISAFAFGLFCFVFLLVEWLRSKDEIQDDIWGLRVLFMILAVVWFLVNLIVEIPKEIWAMRAMQAGAGEGFPAFSSRSLFYNSLSESILPLAFFFPLIDQLHFYFEVSRGQRHAGLKKRLYMLMAGGSLTGFFASVGLGWMGVRALGSPIRIYVAGYSLEYSEAVSVLLILFSLLMIANYVLSLAWSPQTFMGWSKEGPYFMGLHIALIIILPFSLLLVETILFFGQNRFMASPLVRFLPLIFLFLNLYHAQKSVFFDLFVKRATFFFLSMVIAVTYFGFFIHYSRTIQNHDLMYTVAFLAWLSLILMAPWFYSVIDVVLDRIWLNRKLSAEALIRNFLEEIQFETEESRVLEKAEELLGQMFNTRAEVFIASSFPDECRYSELGLKVESRLDEKEMIRLCMEQRPSRIPYYKRERLLLNGLIDFLAYHLQVIRLQETQRQRALREKELLLDASKSRLKALRAQVNPHFLFNALNAIASFTKTDPDRAEKTVELLSEVFRYTLKYSEKEWVKLEEELDFIASYLEVEKARFGSRLSTEISMEVETAGMLIPAMTVQTLVENAVKHGVSKLKKRGRIRITSVTDGTKLWITVCDNGPGFESGSPSGLGSRSGTGLGLINIRNRLNGYFGDNAEFRIRRIGTETEAQITIPVVEQVGPDIESIYLNKGRKRRNDRVS